MSGIRAFEGRTVVITGAASGIGEALAQALGAAGARLLLADVDLPRLEAVAQALRRQGCICLTQACDVASPAALEALAARAAAELDGADLLINNAGVGLAAPMQSMALADAHWLMDINFWGVVHGCRAFAPQMQARPGSAIVNLSSVFAMVSLPTQSIYNASKAAVRAFSDALREELRADPARDRHGVQVLCVHPGGVRTRIAEQARTGDISAIAESPQAMQAQFRQLARTEPAQAAAAIVQALVKGRTRLLIGADARLGDALFRLLPARASALFSARARWAQQRARPARARDRQ